MLIKNGGFESDRAEFNRRFAGFCKHAPINLTFLFEGGVVRVFGDDRELLLGLDYDWSKSPKANIHDIKLRLLPHYPTFTFVKKVDRPLNRNEIERLSRSGEYSTAELFDMKKTEVVTREYRVERVLHRKNIAFIRDLESNTLGRYRFKMPLFMFLKEVFEGDRAGEYFKTFAQLRNVEREGADGTTDD